MIIITVFEAKKIPIELTKLSSILKCIVSSNLNAFEMVAM